MALHENIRARRTQLKLSQEYVAEKLGVSRQAVAKLEAGKSEPTAANLARLAALFEMNVSELAAPPALPDAAVQKASPRRHNARMLAGRWAAVLLMNAGWDGYSSGLYASMPAYWLAILCAGLVLLLLTSLDMQKRWKLQRLQLAVGAALLFFHLFSAASSLCGQHRAALSSGRPCNRPVRLCAQPEILAPYLAHALGAFSRRAQAAPACAFCKSALKLAAAGRAIIGKRAAFQGGPLFLERWHCAAAQPASTSSAMAIS